MAAPTYVGYGTNSLTGISPAAPGYPASLASGDLLVLETIVREQSASCTVDTPSGWTARGVIQGGAGSENADTGNVRVAVFTKESDGTESGTLSVVASGGSLSVLVARISAYRKTGGTTWDIAHATATDNAGGASSLSFVFGTDPGLETDDWAVCCVGVNTDAFTYSAHALTASGITEGTVTVRYSNGTNSGNDAYKMLSTHAIASGTSAGVPTLAITASGNAADAPAGAAILVRLREVAAAGTVIPLFMHNYRQRRSA